MLSYKEFEIKVFDWLISKHKIDPLNTFSLRQKANKGAETDYFIGTENSKYFGTTFWTIPTAYPGSSMDLIDVFFIFRDNEKFDYYIEFNQTKKPYNKQNKSALELIRNIKPLIKKQFASVEESPSKNKMESFYILSTKYGYESIGEMFTDLEDDLNKLFPIIDQEIQKIKKVDKQFIGHRISQDEFNSMMGKLQNRLNKYAPTSKGIKIIDKDINNRDIPLNQILYGPPGVGKTYNTINTALEIIGEKIIEKTRKEVKDLFDSKMAEGQIVFTTFHQSMCYEDFIEGIKPIEPEKEGDPVVYKNILGIFRNLCIEACFSIAQLRESKTTEEVLDFSILYDNFAEGVEEKLLNGQKVELETKAGGTVMVESISQQGNFIIKHHDGVRTYTVSKARLTKLQFAINNLNDVSNINAQFREIIGGNNSSAYWSVLNAIRKEKPPKTLNKESRNYTFDEKKEVVLSLSKTDYKNNEGKPYVLIIDEINRGNISQIFGELITLLEEDKRLGKEEALEAILPYSKEKFGVPPNLYIIGTMNTADRSVEALDSALRRRFSFDEIQPKPALVSPQRKIWELWWKYSEEEWNDPAIVRKEKELFELLGIESDFEDYNKIWEKMKKEGKNERQISYFNTALMQGTNLELVLHTINKRIESLLDKDHQIGHSYFMTVFSINDLKLTFQNKIIPLLQEYFFGDYGKIGLVLGKGFFEPMEVVEENIFASFYDYDASDYSEKTIYKIKDLATMPGVEFIEAINILLNK